MTDNIKITEKINEILTLIDCNCQGKHQSAINILKEMLYEHWINLNQENELDTLRVYQEYSPETYQYEPRLLLMELYKQIYFLNMYPYEDLNKLLIENNVYLRMKNSLYWIELLFKKDSSILNKLDNHRINQIRMIANNDNDVFTKINELREIVSEEEIFSWIKRNDIKR